MLHTIFSCFLISFLVGQHWGTYHIQIALCEWGGVMFILLYNLSMVYEFHNEYAAEILMGSSSASLPTSAPKKKVAPTSSSSDDASPYPLLYPPSGVPVQMQTYPMYYYPLQQQMTN